MVSSFGILCQEKSGIHDPLFKAGKPERNDAHQPFFN
jgi:hypothetical protein